MSDLYKNCELCPRRCKIDRRVSRGFCGQSDKLKICRASLHMWEEPCISGSEGSGTVFFSGCQLKCIYCQNSDIALSHAGIEIPEERLVEIFFELAMQGANNINLVTPSHFTPTIVSAIDRARAMGFALPFVWNSSAYEEINTLELLCGKIDIFLPDFKYFSSDLAKSFSYASDYLEKASSAISKMLDIAGKAEFDSRGIMKKGVIVRHLVLPAHTDDSIKVIKYLFDSFGHDIYISIMNQYTPMQSVSGRKDLSRRLTTYEYEKVVGFARELGICNGFTQARTAAQESFIPAFDYTGVLKKD